MLVLNVFLTLHGIYVRTNVDNFNLVLSEYLSYFTFLLLQSHGLKHFKKCFI